MLLAASTQRSIAVVLFAIVAIGLLAYLFFNMRAGRAEIGSEIELAANRKPYMSDSDLEGKKLDRSLLFGVVTLGITAVSLPLYWLGEPGRQEGRIVDDTRIFGNRGEEVYEEGAQCVNCHGGAGAGGVIATTLTDSAGEFVAQVTWEAPALNNILSRHSEDEILYVLNFGRNGVMPAWGAPGGGPLTEQELENVIVYLRRIQIPEDDIRSQVDEGLRARIADYLTETSDDAWAVAIRDARVAADEATANLDDLEEAAADAAIAAATAKATGLEPDPTEIDGPSESAVELAASAAQDASAALGQAGTDAAEEREAAIDAFLAEVDETVEAARALAVDEDSSLGDDLADAADDDARAAAENAIRLAGLELLSTGEADNSELYWTYGEMLFTNEAAAGSYGCARCHTTGWSYDAVDVFGLDGEPIQDEYVQGGGWFGPNLTNGSTLQQFETAAGHSQFITIGQQPGQRYGRSGDGGNGQMPGFGPRSDDDVDYPALLTQDQIDAIVAFERGALG